MSKVTQLVSDPKLKQHLCDSNVPIICHAILLRDLGITYTNNSLLRKRQNRDLSIQESLDLLFSQVSLHPTGAHISRPLSVRHMIKLQFSMVLPKKHKSKFSEILRYDQHESGY